MDNSNSIEDFLQKFYSIKALDKEKETPVNQVKPAENIEPISQAIEEQHSSDLFYHIILDCDMPSATKKLGNGFVGEYTGHMRDFLKNNSNRVPILYSYDEVINVSGKLVNYIMQEGTSTGKRVPVFGAIALGYKLNDVKVENANIDVAQHGGKDYRELFNKLNEVAQKDDTEVINYNVKGLKRGLISGDALKNKCALVSMTYCYLTNMDLNVGLCLLNMLPQFSEDDIRVLRQVHANKGKPHMLLQNITPPISNNVIINAAAAIGQNDSVNLIDTATSEIATTPIKNDKNDNNHKGGNYEKLYKTEKKKYMQLKEIAKVKGINF